MIDMKAIDQHSVLRGDHVAVVIVREAHAQAVRWLTRFAMSDVIRKNNVKLRDVERLARTEENARENRIEQRIRAPAGAMEKQNRIVGVAVRIAVRATQRKVVQLQLRQ